MTTVQEMTVAEISAKLGYDVKIVKEEPEVIKEMTVAEISEKLGYEVKIVSEEPLSVFKVTDEDENQYDGDVFLEITGDVEINDDISFTIHSGLVFKVEVGDTLVLTPYAVSDDIKNIINIENTTTALTEEVNEFPEFYNFYQGVESDATVQIRKSRNQ